MTQEITEPLLDIILPTHNRLEMTVRCLQHLYQFTSVPFRVFMIDDSTDLTPTWVEQNKKDYPALNYVRPEEPFTSGNQIINLGLQISTTPIVAHICNSILVEPMWVDLPYLIMKQQKEVGVMGFKLLMPQSGLIEHTGIGLGGLVPIDIGRNEPSNRYSFVAERDAVAWSLVLLRREAVVGNLAEDVYNGFRGWDDIDNCCVIKQKGWKILYCGAGSAYHYAHYTRMAQGLEQRKQIYDNMQTFIRRFPDKIKATEACPTCGHARVKGEDRDDLLDIKGNPPLDLELEA